MGRGGVWWRAKRYLLHVYKTGENGLYMADQLLCRGHCVLDWGEEEQQQQQNGIDKRHAPQLKSEWDEAKASPRLYLAGLVI